MPITLTYHAAEGSTPWLLTQTGDESTCWVRVTDIDRVILQKRRPTQIPGWDVMVAIGERRFRAVHDDARTEAELEAAARDLLVRAARDLRAALASSALNTPRTAGGFGT